MQLSRLSIPVISIKHRLPLLIGTLLLGIILASTWAAYEGVKESAFDVGRERLQNLTKQLGILLQQSNNLLLTKTSTAANDPAIKAFLRDPSPATRSGAMAVLQQLDPPQDANTLQVELWDTNHSLVLTMPDGRSPESPDLKTEFKAADETPFRSTGSMRVVKDVITAPALAAVSDDSGKPIGYLVRWRRMAINPAPKQLTDLLGSEAALYFGNNQGNFLTNLERIISKPRADLGSTGEVMHYARDGNNVMAMERPISGTPWFLLVEFPEQPYLAQADRFLRRIILIDIVLLTVGIAAAFALSRRITRPLKSLTAAAASITDGDYAQTVDVQHGDELGLLAAGFNTMAHKVRSSQSELEKNIEALGDSEHRLQTVIENLSEGLVISGLDGQLLNWNRAALQLHGFASLDECLIKLPDFANIFELSDLNGSVLELEQWPLPRVIRGETLRNVELRIRRLDSDWNRVFNYGGSLVREASGKFAAIVTMSDITERRRAEERFRLVVEAAPSAMLMVNDKGLMTLVNQQAEQLFGYSRDELMGQPIEILVPERYRAAHPGHRGSFFQHPSTRAMGAGRDLFGQRKDGTEMPIEIGLNPIKTPEGSFVLASIIDITERKRAEERFRLVVEASPSAMLTINEAGCITLVNTQTEQLFGYTRNEMLGQPIEMLVPERYRAAHPGHRSDFFRRPSVRAMGAGRDLYGLRKDGSEVPIEIGLNPVKTSEGSFVLASIIDITERKRDQEQMRLVVEASPNAMIMANEQGHITLVNKQTEKLFGYERTELLGQPLEILIPERYHSVHPGHRAGFFENPSSRAMGAGRDLFGRHKDGSEVSIEIGLNPIRTDQGAFVLASIIDITERKRGEETLRRSQEQLAGVIGSAMDAIVSVDEDQRIVLFNTAAERMFLFPSEDAIGQRLDRFIPERFRATHKGHIEDFGATHVTRRSMGTLGALYGLRADGEEFPIEASISQIESEGKKIYTVILRDITERKRAEEALKEQGRILDLAPVLIRDLGGRIIFWNSGSERMYGWTREEALESTSQLLLKTEFPRPVEEIKARLFARGHWEGELVHTRRDGERIVVASHWVLHKNELDEPKAILEVNNDITERKEAEKEIRRLNEELEQRVADRTAQLQAANKELEAFSYSVSHDLRAPLRHINGFSQALLEDYADKLDDEGKKYLQEVRNASQEMAQLIDDVLQLARVTRSEMRREQVNLTEVARSVIADLQKTDSCRSVNVTIQDELTAQGDKRLLQIVLTNLLGNAWKFTQKQNRPEITFGTQKQNGEAFYFVRDNGAGFDMAYVNKLFGAFQRLHGSEQFEGTGIGLATVQRIITRHGGRVWAEGALNKGATFSFTLLNSKERGNVQESDSTS